jgi:hypothetical protein
MRGSDEWRAFVNQELSELIHLLDRKADKSQLAKFPSPPEPPVPVVVNAETQHDFTALFSAFNRVARQKLNTTTLAEFAGVPFVDSLYPKRSVQMSVHLTESYTLYYQLFDGKITELEQKTREFEVQCIQRMAVLNERVRHLQTLVRRLLGPAGKQSMPTQFTRTGPAFDHSLSWKISYNAKKSETLRRSSESHTGKSMGTLGIPRLSALSSLVMNEG